MRDGLAGLSAVVVVAAGAALLLPWPVAAQQQEAGQPGCRLVLTPASDETQSVSVEVAPEQYVTYVGGGINWTCGGARSYADSAVKYDRERRLKMIGSVDYEDALRTLTADTVTYFQARDRILAEGSVELERKSSGALLTGPVVELYRSGGGPIRRTVATGRPRLRVYPDTTARDTADPVLVDADRIELLPGDEAWAWGDVVIQRPDLDARADSAHFAMQQGSGQLFGSPTVEGEGVTLAGRTIRTTFAQGELEEVLAEEEATATGEGFRLFSDRIRGTLEGREIDRLWAFGAGLSVAIAPPNRLAADSLAFRFAGGRIDTLWALGGAQAVETGAEGASEGREALALGAGERSWVAGDTLTLAFAGDTASETGSPPVTDSAGADSAATADEAGAPATAGESRLRSLLAVGDARAYRILRSEEDGSRQSGEPGRHYQIGSEILVLFREGRAHRVEGRSAIGLHLDPLPPGAAADTGGAVPDTSAVTADTAGAVADTVPDTAGAVADTAATVPDTAAVPSDTAPSPPDAAGTGSETPGGGAR